MPLTRASLEHQMCQAAGCTERGHWFGARCHPRAGLTVQYSHDNGAIFLACKKCGKHVTSISVMP